MLGVLIANTGSPAAPTPAALRAYLARFLSDPRIVDLPRPLWLPLLHGIILRFRPARSARLYRRVWTSEGSPLAVTTHRIALSLEAALARPVCAAVGMRYSEPSIAAALDSLRRQGASPIVVLPLFPQVSTATTASIYDAVDAAVAAAPDLPPLVRIQDYAEHPAYIAALAESLGQHFETHGRPERLLLSFHGIPQSYAQRGDPYPARCQATARRLAAALGLYPGEWLPAYQSRFGPLPWLQPYTGRTLQAWGRLGLDRLAVACPGFAADCLETLEEIASTGRKIYETAGGRGFSYVPALNHRPAHIAALAQIILEQLEP